MQAVMINICIYKQVNGNSKIKKTLHWLQLPRNNTIPNQSTQMFIQGILEYEPIFDVDFLPRFICDAP